MSDANRIAAVQKLYDYATAEAKTGVSNYALDSTQQRAKDSGVSPGIFYAYKQQYDALKDGKDPDAMQKTADSILSDHGMPEDDKNKLMESLIIGGISEETAEKYRTKYKGKISPQAYIQLRNEYSKIDKMYEGQENSAGKAEGAWLAYLDGSDLPNDVREAMKSDMSFRIPMPAKPISTSFDMLSQYGGKNEQQYASAVNSSGLTL